MHLLVPCNYAYAIAAGVGIQGAGATIMLPAMQERRAFSQRQWKRLRTINLN